MRRESKHNYVTVSPCNQSITVASGASLYQNQQEAFKVIKSRNGMTGDAVKRAITPEGRISDKGVSAKTIREKENMLMASINDI